MEFDWQSHGELPEPSNYAYCLTLKNWNKSFITKLDGMQASSQLWSFSLQNDKYKYLQYKHK